MAILYCWPGVWWSRRTATLGNGFSDISDMLFQSSQQRSVLLSLIEIRFFLRQRLFLGL
jgi:hypothetical protein